jgi:hypothetical protein
MAVHLTTNGILGTTAGFQAVVSSSHVSATGAASTYAINWTGTTFDTGGVHSGTTFTAPVSGAYLLFSTWNLDDLDAGSHTYIDASINTSNRSYGKYDYRLDNIVGGIQTQHIGAIADMDANDTAIVYTNVQAGSQDVDVLSAYSYFSAMLIGGF